LRMLVFDQLEENTTSRIAGCVGGRVESIFRFHDRRKGGRGHSLSRKKRKGDRRLRTKGRALYLLHLTRERKERKDDRGRASPCPALGGKEGGHEPVCDKSLEERNESHSRGKREDHKIFRPRLESRFHPLSKGGGKKTASLLCIILWGGEDGPTLAKIDERSRRFQGVLLFQGKGEDGRLPSKRMQERHHRPLLSPRIG